VQLVVLLVMLAAAWGFVIVPQQRRIKAHRAFVGALAVGDDVVTSAGVYGTITALDTETARLRVAPEVEITIARMAIGRHQSAAAGRADAAPGATPLDASE
jgi:preprotein translocase subunit YajC